ncbi:Lrp/AsnC ligand binding domain-containing protein [Candidatus Woesearchaeota archaeon]|nr:Lrp/AsnC ligand binding domain-containing protein [Candidatus Woesearchaeota archaeon]
MYAYILVALDESGVEDIVEEFRDLEEVQEAHILFGEWDLIIKVKAPEPESVARFVLEKVRNKEEVRLTSTLIVAK